MTNELVKDVNHNKTLLGKTKYRMWKLIHAGEYRSFFVDKTKKFEEYINGIDMHMKSLINHNNIKRNEFTRFTSDFAKKFWNSKFEGKEEANWSLFIAAYNDAIYGNE